LIIRDLILGWIKKRKTTLQVSENNDIDPQVLARLQILQSAELKITNIVNKHLDTLARRRFALVKVDHYGVVQSGDWNKEVQHFVDKVVRPTLSDDEAFAIGPKMNSVFQEMIEDRVAKRVDQIEADLNFDNVTTPEAFERWCAKILEKDGWSASVTKATGDQGADVLARKGNTSIILQCKLYSRPVGNKAVQEAFSAQRHYATQRSAVVTNAGYTNSACELARTTKVLLLHFSDLAGLEMLLGEC
jgi:restriction system protein